MNERRATRRVAASNAIWLLADKGMALVIGLIIQGLIARGYGPMGTGHFAYASALLQVTLGLSMVCAGTALLPRLCRASKVSSGTLANIFALRLASSFVAVLAMWIFCWLTIDDLVRLEVSMALVAAVPLVEPFYLFATYWLSRNRNKPTVVARSAGLMVRLALVAVCAAVGVPIWLLALAWIIEASVNAAFQTVQIRAAFVGQPFRSRVRLSRMVTYLKFGLRFVAALWLMQVFLRLDRLIVAEHLNAHDFGIYAAPMQLVEVWSQVAYLVGSSIATAYLYKNLRGPNAVRAFMSTFGMMVVTGLAGLAASYLLGAQLLRLVYGADFVNSLPFLLAGAAAAVMVFGDQAVDLLIMALNQPRLLGIKWATAVTVAVLIMSLGFDHVGAFVGPIGIAAGLAAGWVAVWAAGLRPGGASPSGGTRGPDLSTAEPRPGEEGLVLRDAELARTAGRV